MLGIFLIICLVIFWFTKLKAYKLSRIICNQSAEIDNDDKIGDICRQAVTFHAISGAAALIGYLGCIWPYLFIEEISRRVYIVDIGLGVALALFIAVACYLDIRFIRNPAKAIIFPFNFWLMMASLPLFYTSYCCIDYDFFRKDYTALFNNLGADSNKPENAWPYYVEAVEHHTKLEEGFQKIVNDGIKSGQLNLTDEQHNNLRKWFDENASSWASLKKAACVKYCNATYKKISFPEHPDQNDFTRPSIAFVYNIGNFYGNVTTGHLAGIFDLDWFDLFKMELGTSRQFVGGKTFQDRLLGYATLRMGVKLLAREDSYTIEDLQKARKILKEYFPSGLPILNAEGEILMSCATYSEGIHSINLPVETPFNRAFMQLGSISGTEAYVRKQYKVMLEGADKGVEANPRGFSIINFPTQRKAIFNDNGNTSRITVKIYKNSQRANTNLSAAYVLLDLEEYKLIKGNYPVDIFQLKQAGLTSQLPDDPDAKGKIIYCNDGQRAILYAVGKNAKDDGGYTDDKDSDEKRDDIIYWQRNLKEEINTAH
jgi:hypothetical protein